MITDLRQEYRPFEYNEPYEIYLMARSAHWTPDEVNIAGDILNWNKDLTEDEKQIIGGILKGFTQMEVLVGDYWRKIANWFPKPEIQMMCSAFSYFETIHQTGYALINEQLGLDDFKAFLYDETTKNKIDYFLENGNNDVKSVGTKLAIFSAFGEGVSLFSSFAILLSFQRLGLLKGIGQIVSWSVRDENCFTADTKVTTLNGIYNIVDLVGREVTIFDGKNWVKCDNFKKYGRNSKVMYSIELIIPTVEESLISGEYYHKDLFIECTDNHRWFVYDDNGNIVEKLTKDLKLDDRLENIYNIKEGMFYKIKSIFCKEKLNVDVYCCNVPTTGKFLLDGGVMTGNCHSNGGVWLFNKLCEETPGLKAELKSDIISAATTVYDLEIKFISELFKDRTIRTLTYEQLENFIRNRINKKLEQMGYEAIYVVNNDLLSQMSWFNLLSSGKEFGDFFAVKPTAYTETNFTTEQMW